MYIETSCVFPVDYCLSLWSLRDIVDLVVLEIQSCKCVTGHFAVRFFAVGYFAMGHFAVRTLRRKDISSWDISPYDFFGVGHFAVFFAVRTFRRKYFLMIF